jgi:hypothetical protein
MTASSGKSLIDRLGGVRDVWWRTHYTDAGRDRPCPLAYLRLWVLVLPRRPGL